MNKNLNILNKNKQAFMANSLNKEKALNYFLEIDAFGDLFEELITFKQKLLNNLQYMEGLSTLKEKDIINSVKTLLEIPLSELKRIGDDNKTNK